jgi:hypothetical protein
MHLPTTLTSATVAFLLLASSSCARRDVNAPPIDRHGHALILDDGAGSAAPPPGAPAAAVVTSQRGPAGPGETTVVIGSGETLYDVAQRFDVDLAWLIERNDFTTRPGPGDSVIVPDRGVPVSAEPEQLPLETLEPVDAAGEGTP